MYMNLKMDKKTITHRDFWVFILLSFLLLALIPLFAWIFNDGSLDFDTAAQRATDRTGLIWTSNILVVLRMCLAEPVLFLNLLGSFIPSLAALVTIFIFGHYSVKELCFQRLHPGRKLDGLNGLFLYAEILILALVILFMVFVIRNHTGHGDGRILNIEISVLLPALLTMAFLDQGAILEELGWRGYGVPSLQDKGMNPVRSALIIGICWGLWHVPRDLTTGVLDRLGIDIYLGFYLPSFVLGTIGISVLASYYMNRSGGSVLPAIILHGLTNDSFGLSGQVSIVEALTPYHQITKAIPVVMVAVLFIWISKGKLGVGYVKSD